jgi:tRNA (guanine-N7-)-methyltransferase
MSDVPDRAAPPRAVRSFVRRQGRLTDGQRRALVRLWPRYGLEPGAGPLDLGQVFGRAAPRMLEIGFGMGDTLLAMAAADPASDYLGIDVYRPGIGRLLAGIERLGLGNLRILEGDAVTLLERHLAPSSLTRLLLLFPDPWPKKRHHKRRLLQPAFAALAASRLGPGGILHAATDWVAYAEAMLEVLEACPGLRNMAGAGCYAERPAYRPLTKFEVRGQALGHEVRDLLFRRDP